MKGEITLKILEKLSEAAAGTGDLLEAFLASGYIASRGKIEYTLRRIEKRRARESERKKEQLRLRWRYYNILSWLKRDGLIIERANSSGKLLHLTRDGLQKLSFLKKRRANALPKPFYGVVENNNFAIIAFDVPEKERRKRAWIRSVLKNTGFTMLQKSVWIGKIKIPKSFIDDLYRLKIAEFVEIFEITKTGSLRHMA